MVRVKVRVRVSMVKVTAIHIDTRLAVARVGRVRLRGYG